MRLALAFEVAKYRVGGHEMNRSAVLGVAAQIEMKSSRQPIDGAKLLTLGPQRVQRERRRRQQLVNPRIFDIVGKERENMEIRGCGQFRPPGLLRQALKDEPLRRSAWRRRHVGRRSRERDVSGDTA